MRIIPTLAHGVLDYLLGLLLVASPWLFGFAALDFATGIPLVIGTILLVYSLLTEYELALVRCLPVPFHLALDVAGGTALLVSPWLFAFDRKVYLPHLVIGLAQIVTPLLARTSGIAAAPQPSVHERFAERDDVERRRKTG